MMADIDSEVPDHLLGDLSRLRQVMTSLTSYVIKLATYGEVILSVFLLRKEAGKVKLKFHIYGAGESLTEDQRKMVFNLITGGKGFYGGKRGDPDLSLGISAQLVGLMGAELQMSGGADGRGNIFSFELNLPFMKAASPAREMALDKLAGLRVAVLADNSHERRILMEQLHSWKLKPVDCATIDEAIRLLKVAEQAQKGFDLVLADMDAPLKNGRNIAEIINHDLKAPLVPMVLFSSDETSGEGWPSHYPRLIKPVRPEELAAAMVSVLEGRIDENSNRGDNVEAGYPQLKILLAEDMEMHQLVACKMLNDMGHEVRVANNGYEALVIWAAEKIDLIFMDIQMPIMDGSQAAARIRLSEKKLGEGSRIPIVALTAYDIEEGRLENHFDAYLPKPLARSNLAAMLDSIAVKLYSPGQ